jgi:hypothetical protein
MSHTIIYNSESQTVEIKARGNIPLHEAKEIVSETIRIAKLNDCFLILNDFREAKLNLSTMEIYNLPKIISDLAASEGLNASLFKRAAVIVKDENDFRFFETVTFNQFQTMKIFQDINEAKNWLLKE